MADTFRATVHFPPGTPLADVMTALRAWLDHHRISAIFEFWRSAEGALIVTLEFANQAELDLFQKDHDHGFDVISSTMSLTRSRRTYRRRRSHIVQAAKRMPTSPKKISPAQHIFARH